MRSSLLTTLIILLVLPPGIAAQTAPARPAPTPHLGRQPGLVDSLKQGSSSCGTDYGERIEDVRTAIVDNTIKSYEFWLAVASIGLNAILFLYVLHLDARRRQVIRSTAHLVTKYQSQLAAGQRSYQRLDREYSKFVSEFEQEKEPRISTRPPIQRGRSAEDIRTLPADARTASPAPRPASLAQAGASPQASAAAAPMEETVVSMRQQITTLTHQLEAERQKNRKLRGE